MTRTELIEELKEIQATLFDISRKSYEMKLIFKEKGTNIDEGFLNTLKQNEYDIRRIANYLGDDIEDLIDELDRLD